MIKRLLYTGFMTWLVFVCVAQQNNTMYFLEQLPQGHKLNPVFQNNYEWFVGIPILSSFHFSYAHSGFSLGEVIEKEEGTYRINTNNLLSTLGRTNLFGLNFETDYFNIGHKKDDEYFSFYISDKFDMPIFYDKDNLDILINGTEGEDLFKLKSNGLFLNYYREYAFGYSKSFFERSYGFRAKILFGKLNFSSRKADMLLGIEDYTNVLSFEEEINLTFSLPVRVDYKDDGKTVQSIQRERQSGAYTFFNPRNPGISFDAGYRHNVSYRFNVYASVLDAGFILWRDKTYKLKSENTYVYRGFLTDDSEGGSLREEIFEDFISGSDFTGEEKSYITLQPTKIYVGGKYDITGTLNAGLLLHGQIYRHKFLPSATVSVNTSFTDWFTSSLSYSLMYGTYQNVGFGITLGKSPTQIYFVTDNISNFTFPFRNKEVFLKNRIALWPFWTQNINFRFGININLKPGETQSLQRIRSDSSFGNDENERRIRRMLRQQRSDRNYQKVLRRNKTK